MSFNNEEDLKDKPKIISIDEQDEKNKTLYILAEELEEETNINQTPPKEKSVETNLELTPIPSTPKASGFPLEFSQIPAATPTATLTEPQKSESQPLESPSEQQSTLNPYSSYSEPSDLFSQDNVQENAPTASYRWYSQPSDSTDQETNEKELKSSEGGINDFLKLLWLALPFILISLLSKLLDIILPSFIGDLVVLLSFSIVGALAVFFVVPDNLSQKIEENKILDKLLGEYLEIGRKINEDVKGAIDIGGLKGAFQFSKSMVKILFYSLGIALVSILTSLTFGLFVPNTPDMFVSFSWLYGAGIAALFRWFIILRKKKQEMDNFLHTGSTKDYLKSSLSIFATIYTLMFGMIFWGGGLFLFISYSPEQMYLLPWVILPFVIPLLIVLAFKVFVYMYKTNKKMNK